MKVKKLPGLYDLNLEIEPARRGMLHNEHSNNYTTFVLSGSASHRPTEFSTLEDSLFQLFQSLSSLGHRYRPRLIIYTFTSRLTHSADSTIRPKECRNQPNSESTSHGSIRFDALSAVSITLPTYSSTPTMIGSGHDLPT